MIEVRRRDFGWLPTVLVLAVVLIAGSRLIYLSAQHRSAEARTAAATVGARLVAKIEPKLRELAARAAAAAGTAPPPSAAPVSAAVAAGTAPSPQAAAQPHPLGSLFRMSADDKPITAPRNMAPDAAGLASEWASADSRRAAPAAAVLGPVRLGSQWLVAVRAPIGGDASRGWAVSFADLDDVVADSHPTRLADQGYDFEIGQAEPRSARSRTFITSSPDPLEDAVITRIRLPQGYAPAVPGSFLQVAVRPRAGWFPATDLASDIGLLAFLAWLLAFGTHELSQSLQRSRGALATSRRRLHAVNKQLSAEMQQRLQLQETFDHARFHDAFTGLPNRRYFMDQLDRALRDVRTKRRQRLAVVIVDIARFKLINDMLGHTAGDELMVQAARRFEKSMAALDYVLSRWGGDQFAVLILDHVSTEAAVSTAAALLEELGAPFELRRHRLSVRAAIGVTSADSGQQRAEDVVREADIALSVAKRRTAEKVVAYSASMAGQTADLVSLEADLHVALEKHELRLLFQPIVDLRTYRMIGAEALLRWRHPVESLLAPDKFLRIAEDAGLMVPITRWVILRACKMIAQWRRRLLPEQRFFISVNLAPSALRDPGLSDYIVTLMRETQIPPWALKFELTEAALLSNVGAARETLERLHALGVQLMLDDFGTGYSSLSHLQLFPFDFVKIERPFVNRTEGDQVNTGMMSALVQMASSLRLTPVAELIETEAAAHALREMGCDYGQGFYFSEPLEAELALQRLQSRRPFEPRRESAETMQMPPLEVDDSPTIMMSADSLAFPHQE
ncbi:MAG TPA: bifunctional diguanylate cyclase/phosphodiesterase [Steroidobacteraceae bacterium]